MTTVIRNNVPAIQAKKSEKKRLIEQKVQEYNALLFFMKNGAVRTSEAQKVYQELVANAEEEIKNMQMA